MLPRFVTQGGGWGARGGRGPRGSRRLTHTNTPRAPSYPPAAAAAARAGGQEEPWRSRSSETRRPRSGRSVGRQAAAAGRRRPQRSCRREMLPGGFMAHSAPGRRGGRPAGGQRGALTPRAVPVGPGKGGGPGRAAAGGGTRQAAPHGGTRPSGSSLHRYGKPLPQREGGRTGSGARAPSPSTPRPPPTANSTAGARAPTSSHGVRVGWGGAARPLSVVLPPTPPVRGVTGHTHTTPSHPPPHLPAMRSGAGPAASPSCHPMGDAERLRSGWVAAGSSSQGHGPPPRAGERQGQAAPRTALTGANEF